MKTITANITPTDSSSKFFARFPETTLTINELKYVKGGGDDGDEDNEYEDPIIPSGGG